MIPGAARSAQQAMAGGAIRVSDALQTWCQVIEQREPDVRAWAWLDLASARAQALCLDERPTADRSGMPLFGLPVGIKDIIDTADMPTQNGTVLHAGRRPSADAALVARLRQAGALIPGKTVTTELATYAPGPTRNPRNLAHTPGGSSSGSAAAVACGMVPLAIGTQTNGSVLRPAAFCGVVGFKPSQCRISRQGVLVQSPTFDTVGLMAGDVDGVALLYEALADDPWPAAYSTDSSSGDRWDAQVSKACHQTIPQGPPFDRWVWWGSPWWDRMTVDAQAFGFAAASRLTRGSQLPDGSLPAERIVEWHRLIMEAEIARSFDGEYRQGRDRLSDSLRGQIERGSATSDDDLAAARLELMALRRSVDDMLDGRVDVLLTMPALGAAPRGLHATGDPILCTVATALDLPAVTVPLGDTAEGLPIGLQLIGRRGQDRALLEAARRAEAAFRNPG